MMRSGLSRNLINKLIEDELIEEIIVKNNGELLFSKKFIEYLNNQDELFKFEFYRINGKIDWFVCKWNYKIIDFSKRE